MKRKFQITLISFVFLIFLYVYHSFTYSDNNFHLIFCDVGQGDGILIKTSDKKEIIIDGGPSENGITKCLERHLPFWDREIDAVFLTHPDSDHVTGLIGVMKSYNVRYFGTSKAPKETEVYKELIALVEEEGLEIDWVFKDDKVVDGKFSMTALWPTVEFLKNPSDDTNDYSLVHLVEHGKFRAMLTGDLDAIYINSLMPIVGRLDVFKLPHHGSKTGVDEFTFQHVLPSLAIISVGQNNRYGHPHKEVIQVLKSKNIQYKYTFEGDVEIVSDGEKWWIK